MSEYDAFAAVYDEWTGPIGQDDVDFYVSLAAEAEGPVVELAVGNGRVAVPIAVRTGRRVIGIDVSPAMLAGASERARAAGVELDLRLGDMRELALEERTDLVICPFRSLLHVHGHHGRLASSAVWRRRSIPADASPGTRSSSTRDRGGARRTMARAGRCPPPRRLRRRGTPDRPVPRGRPDGLPVVGDPEEWDRLVEESGLEVEARFGWFDRRPFDESSREAVYVARKTT